MCITVFKLAQVISKHDVDLPFALEGGHVGWLCLLDLQAHQGEGDLLTQGGQVVKCLDRVHVGQQQVPVNVKERVRREETCWPREGR